MLQLERQNDILRLLNEKKELTVKELCALLYCSPATVLIVEERETSRENTEYDYFR